jgi:hypothetical protein
MFYNGECTCELNICFLNVLKFYLRDVDEAMFDDVERPLERILYILGNQESNLNQVAKVMFN